MFERQPFYTLATLLFLATSTAAFADDDISACTTTIPTEMKNSYNWWQPMVGATTAYTTGNRGGGIIVGILDTGINTANLEFKGRLAPGYNAIYNNTYMLDDNGHGTHVAGILGAAADNGLMVGIAPQITILPIKVLNAKAQGSYTSLALGMRYAISHGARVVNLSLGGSVPVGPEIFQGAVAAGELLVLAAGNAGTPNPDFPAQFAIQSWANNQMIAVGTVNANSTLAYYSNRAGNTAAHYVVAPGSNILSTSGANGYAYMSGTSMSTPIVSGMAADILSQWSYLKANQVASIIFQTATHLGTSAATVPDTTYGWGLVNLTKALQPIGNPYITSTTGSTQTLTGSTLSTNSLLTAKAFSGLTITAKDDYGRAYGYDLGQFVRQPEPASLTTIFGNLDKQLALVTRTTPSARLTYSLYGTSPETLDSDSPFYNPDAPRVALGGFNYIQKFGSVEYAAGTNGFAEQYFGLVSDYQGVPLSNNFANPYLQFAGTSSHFATGYTLGADYKVKVGLLNGSTPLAHQSSLASTASGADGWVGEVEKRFTEGVLRATVGAIKENDAALGAMGSGVLAMAGAQTNFISAAGAYDLSAKNSLLALVSTGSTMIAGNGLLGDGEARTMGWSLGLLHQDTWREGDKLAFSLSQPLRVVSGQMAVALPTVDGYGVSGFTSTALNLASEKTETDFELGYLTPLSKTSSLNINAAYKQNVTNSEGDAAVVAVRYNVKF